MALFDAGQSADLQRAWQRLAPDEDEVRFAATRIAARLRRPAPHAILRPRSAAVVSGAVILAAALAYAAEAGRAWVQTMFRPTPAPLELAPVSAPEPLLVPTAIPIVRPAIAPSSAVPRISPAIHPASTPRRPKASPRPSHTDEPLVAPPVVVPDAGASSDDASWRLVDRALADHDDESAIEQLQSLTTASHDARTRTAARVGLAQLYAGRGECAEARRIAVSVATEPGVPISTARRAQRILGTCFAR